MSEQLDWVGAPHSDSRPFRDIRNQRPSVAEQKAALALELGRLLTKPPASVVNGSVQKVREWQAARARAAKVAGSSRSSVPELTAAINNMRRF